MRKRFAMPHKADLLSPADISAYIRYIHWYICVCVPCVARFCLYVLSMAPDKIEIHFDVEDLDLFTLRE